VRSADAIRKIVEAGVPVMGHVGLTPQSVHGMGGFRIQGRGEDARRQILEDAKAVEQAGAYSIVLEGVPSELAEEITGSLRIPTIGIGAGPECDGQVLVCYDLLGMFRALSPKFVKRYAELGDAIVNATQAYATEVRAGTFPSAEHSFSSGEPAKGKR
jgi:3-methyl-2-oxobutanoate hydroxymethyltransferase